MHTALKRLATLGAAAMLALSASGGLHAQDLKEVRISLLPFPEVSPIYIAIEKGYFAEEGLNVTTVPSTGGAAAIPGLIGGSFEFAYGNIVSNILAVDKGLDVKVLAGTTHIGHDDGGIIALAASNITSGKDLEGKTVGVNTRNNIIWLMSHEWVRATGGDPAKVTFKEVPFPQMYDALKSKQVDAVNTSSQFYLSAVADPEVAKVANPNLILQPDVQIGQYSTTGALIQNDPEMVNGFLRALRKASDWYDANRESEELFQIVAGYTGLSLDQVKEQSLLGSYTRINEEEMQKTMDMMVAAGLLAAPIPIENVVHDSGIL